MHASGTVLFCESSTDERAVENARAYVRDNNLTSEQVRIARNGTHDITSVIVR